MTWRAYLRDRPRPLDWVEWLLLWSDWWLFHRKRKQGVMTERRRSTATYTTMAFVDYADRPGEYREVELLGPISEAHRERGHRLRRARIDARLTLKQLADAANLPDFGMVELSQAQAGIIELGEGEWVALYRALGREEAAEW